ncbi:MAG: hypothetical protein SWC96_06800, partial [Thermodesulfobacteriota bacterium]|nr:hypothetical protein [Thermodesulfobacteriota bacterium]
RSDGLRRFRLFGCNALTGTLQAGMRSGFLPARSDAVRRFRLSGCNALTGTLQAGMRSGFFLFVVTASGVFGCSGAMPSRAHYKRACARDFFSNDE